ncbi:MAG TPA: cation transporter [Thermoanaerobaculia bacterium]|nr:cation transporter [Thermoanaerobaculia bacterium]
MTATAQDTPLRPALLRRGRVLEYATVVYNVLEGVIAIGSGVVAGSVALIGFGIDSGIEVLSGLVLLWRLNTRRDEEERERAEARALKLVGASFLLLAAYVAYDAVASLARREAPDESRIGIALAAVSVIVMPLLVRAKRRVAAQLKSRALAADSKQTELCTWLSAILLAGLGLNALAGWWWADPVAALIMVPIIANEGIEALRGEHCDDCA